jgi:3-hydroxy-9,10-secoandrosta-1,3,5(10)-triene-9,17-dione monooxygenase reductase component
MSQSEVTAEKFRRVMGGFATGVTVVTTICDGQPYGLTVNALCSVSLDPPLLAISLQRTSRTLAMIERSGRFAVNVLSAEQHALAERFARKDLGDMPFNAVPYHRGAQVRDVALFDEALARIECVVASAYPGGDHVVLLGVVMALEQDSSVRASRPLLFYRSAFHTLQPETVAPG